MSFIKSVGRSILSPSIKWVLPLVIQSIVQSAPILAAANSKMEVQKLNHKILFALGMCLRSDASQLKRIASTAVNVLLVIFVIAFGVNSSVAYMYTHADNLQNCLLSAYQVAAYISCTGVYVTFAMQKAIVHNVFIDCSRIAIQRKRWHNDLRYERTERKCNFGALLPLTILVFFVGNSVVASAQSIISGYLNGRWDPLKWYTPYKMTWVVVFAEKSRKKISYL